MALVRWDPISELAGHRDRQAQPHVFGPLQRERFAGLGSAGGYLRDREPRSGHQGGTSGHEARADHVTFENNVLTLKGERAESEVSQDRFRRVERRSGTFSRSFTLPNTADATGITASYKDGVLTVRHSAAGRGEAEADRRRVTSQRHRSVRSGRPADDGRPDSVSFSSLASHVSHVALPCSAHVARRT